VCGPALYHGYEPVSGKKERGPLNGVSQPARLLKEISRNREEQPEQQKILPAETAPSKPAEKTQEAKQSNRSQGNCLAPALHRRHPEVKDTLGSQLAKSRRVTRYPVKRSA
jgi:hypothetical protein